MTKKAITLPAPVRRPDMPATERAKASAGIEPVPRKSPRRRGVFLPKNIEPAMRA